MGSKRKPARLKDRRGQRHIKVEDAASLVGDIETFFRSADGLPRRHPHAAAAAVALNIWNVWARSQVVLRVDGEFANALLDTDTDVELVPDWMSSVTSNGWSETWSRIYRFTLHSQP